MTGANEAGPTALAVRDALSAGVAGFAALLAESLPGAALHQEPNLEWVDSGLPYRAFNFVYASSLPAGELDQGVALVRDHFRGRRRRFHWKVGDSGEPPDMIETLVRHGLRFDESEPAMGLDPRVRTEPATPVPGLRVLPVTSADLLRQWTEVWGCGAPADVIEPWYRVYAALPYGPDGPLRMFLGLLDDVPVATVYLHLAAVRTPGVSPPVLPGPVSAPGQSATVHYVVTLPEYRRRGIGAVMTEFALREARAAGCRSAVLTASALGAGVYRRLGFRETGLVSTYVWSPDWA